jgi:micrococcal nuclease
MNRPLRATAAAAALGAALAAAAPAAAVTRSGNVTRAVDGDTVNVRIAGRVRTFDLLGVDAPDGRQCFAATARVALRRVLPVGARVLVQNDPRRFGRGRYVFRGATFVNAAMLRAGNARLGSLIRLNRSGTLRNASTAARRARRGLFGRCVPAPAPPPVPPSPIDVANAVRNALVGKQLVDFVSTPRSSTRNTTRFCAGGRSDRTEDFSGEQSFRNDLTGTWAVFEATRQADGTLLANISFLADDPSFDQRLIPVTVAPDGTVRRSDANASELQPGGQCSPSRAPAGFENDTPAARSAIARALTGRRFDEGALGSTDFCSAQRAIRREGGNAVVDGAWTVEWAVSGNTGTVGAIAIDDADSAASRRFLFAIPPSGAPQVRNLGVGDDRNHDTAQSAVLC